MGDRVLELPRAPLQGLDLSAAKPPRFLPAPGTRLEGLVRPIQVEPPEREQDEGHRGPIDLGTGRGLAHAGPAIRETTRAGVMNGETP
jgi:hypothetical protein